ncbi:MAG: HYR domain-containing protein [Saprospiraceae bacterium]|nr:HYR domain-containing protein [Saprospiraceae bacterium]
MLIRTNQRGEILWQKNYGGAVNENFSYVTTTNDDGFLAYGITGTVFNQRYDAWLVKVDSSGNLLWQKSLGEAASYEAPNAPIHTVPGGFLLSGLKGQNPFGIIGSFVTKVDEQGETLWSRYHVLGAQPGSAVVRNYLEVHYATDSLLYATGVFGESAVFATMNSLNGDIIQVIEYKNPHHALRPFKLHPTHDGNFVLIGYATPLNPNNPRSIWLLKIRSDGQVIWCKVYASNYRWVTPIFGSTITSDGGFVISSGEQQSQNNGETDYGMLMKLDGNGDVVWKKSYSEYFVHDKSINNCFEVAGGGLAVIGWERDSTDDVLLIRTDADGEIEGCCSKKRASINPTDFIVEASPMLYEQEDYLAFNPTNLTPVFNIAFVDKSICNNPRPTLHDTLRFCPGESVTIGDSTYTQPATVSLLIPSATDDCDTLATYTLEHEAPDPNAALQLDCPADISVQANVPTIVHYNEPTAWSDCNCPDLTLVRTSGPASGAAFPLGATSVCYQADDACANSRACCFTVTLAPAPPPPSDACDTKTSGCLQFELLQVNRDYAQNWAYHVRLTNSCADAVQYAYLQVPKGLQALAPINDIVYTTANGHTFTARNPNFSPFYSVRYHFAAATLSSGQSETFRYVLPQQADVKYIHAAARLFSGAFVETHLNTFSCPVGTEPQPKPEAGERGDYGGGSTLRVYPNPVSAEEALFIEGGDMEGSDFVLRDLTGRLVLEASVTGSQVRVGEAKLANGLYFFNVLKNGLSVGSGKVVVVR